MRMSEQRSEDRFKVSLTATVSGTDGGPGVRCAIRDASSEGCKLVSSKVQELPETVQVAVEGIEQPIDGQVVWRSHRMAGVQFSWPQDTLASEEPDDWLELDLDQAVD